MKTLRTFIACFVFIALSLLAGPVLAQPCKTKFLGPEVVQKMFDISLQVEKTLNALPEKPGLVLIARGGTDLSRYRLKYSHMAFAVRQADGRWLVLHELNRCSTSRSELYQEGLANFVGDRIKNSDLLIAIPGVALQSRLKQLLSGVPAVAKRFHQPSYSIVAYPFSTQFQNSNGWILEVLGTAMMSSGQATPSRSAVQSWLRQNKYRPTKIYLSLKERLGIRFAVSNAAVADHPASERISGHYSVVTVDSIVQFLAGQRMLQGQLVVDPKNLND